MRRRLIAPLCLLALAGCKEKTFDPPDRARQVAEAEARITPETFDTIFWESDEARGMAGNITFSARCRDCHGPTGEGGTEYARQRDLTIPSLVEPDWRWADSLHAVRRQIFTGHEAGMPTWGVAGISPREIDGAAFYVLEVLRPDMLEASPDGR